MAGPLGKLPPLFGRLLCAAGIALALAGCAVAPFDTDPPTAPRPAAPFDAALFDAYVALGDTERAEYDWRDAAGFYRRADMIAAGERVEPEALDLRKLPEATVPTLAAARKRLVDALGAGARALTPEAAAQAQAGFDCWLQEQEEDLQPDDIAGCRDSFETAMVEVERALKGAVVVLLADPDGEVGAVDLSNDKGSVTLNTLRETAVVPEDDAAPDAAGQLPEQDVQEIFGTALAAQPQAPTTIRLYFQTGTNKLTPESEAALPSVRELIESRVVPGVEIAGHTDRVGAAPVNAKLALKRAQLIEQMLLELGVPPRLIRVDSFGENDPVVPTADGVDEPRNRRVEITVR